MKEYEITLSGGVAVIMEAYAVEVRDGHLYLFDRRLYALADFSPEDWRMVRDLSEPEDP